VARPIIGTTPSGHDLLQRRDPHLGAGGPTDCSASWYQDGTNDASCADLSCQIMAGATYRHQKPTAGSVALSDRRWRIEFYLEWSPGRSLGALAARIDDAAVPWSTLSSRHGREFTNAHRHLPFGLFCGKGEPGHFFCPAIMAVRMEVAVPYRSFRALSSPSCAFCGRRRPGTSMQGFRQHPVPFRSEVVDKDSAASSASIGGLS